jgi:hypothetical protein
MILCQFNGGCMGCCGHDFKSLELVKEAVRRNTLEFRKFKNLEKFRDRAGKWDLRYGVCRNVVMIRGKVFCPLHPARNKGKDLRKGHCDVDYLCKTAKVFSKWNKEKQKKFLEFVEGKGLDVIEYSVGVDDGSLLKEFLRKDLNNK